MESAFIFITDEVEFQEATPKGAKVLATFMELEKPSQNNRIYRIEEALQLAKSLIGKPIRFGFNWLGKHIKDTADIGTVEDAWQDGKKIKGIVRIWDNGIIETLKAGTKYLFSVGGVAKFAEVLQMGKELYYKLHHAICTHLQLLPNDPKRAGFPNAKMEKILEINESVMFTDYDLNVCDELGSCVVLKGIRDKFEESKRIKEEIIKKREICKSIAKEIFEVIKHSEDFVFEK